MTTNLNRLQVHRKSGAELFELAGAQQALSLLDFWQWSASDLVSNATRGRLAEFIVATALGIDVRGVRDEWAAYDLVTKAGTKIEVKSAAYLQTWHQKRPSPITFEVRKTLGWDPETNEMEKTPRRQADIYVCALLAHMDKATLDPLKLDQWRFFVVPTPVLDERTRSQHSITLRSLEKLTRGAVDYTALRAAVEEVVAQGVGGPAD